MRTTEFVCFFLGISERWYKACLRSVTASSGRSRPSWGSTLTKWNPALDPAEVFGTEGKRTPQTMPSADRHAAAAADVSSPPGQPLAFVALWPQSFSRKQWADLHWKQPGGALLGGILCVHHESGNWFLLMQICRGQKLWYGKTDN